MYSQETDLNAWARDPVKTTTRSKRLLAATLLAASMAFLPSAGAANLVVNADFEAGFDSWVVNTEVGWNVFVESQTPNHSGSRVFKTFGHWDSAENETSLHQEFYASPGNTYSAGGWIFSRSTDRTGGDNAGYYEVWFRSASGTTLEIYRSDRYTATSPPDEWIYLNVTNQIDLVTGSIIGTVSTLVAPPNTAFVRVRVVHHSKNYGGGAEHFDDVVLDQISGNLPPSISNLSPNGLSLFNPASAGLTFSAVSTTTNIPTTGIHLALNGLDVTAGLNISGPENNRTVSYTALNSNRLYTAIIIVTDAAGYAKTATVSFDTFVAGNFHWEAEDYDFGGGQYINNPIVTSTNADNSYFGRTGSPDIDFYDPTWGGNGNQAYRVLDNPGPGTEWCGDFPRQKYIDAVAAGDVDAKDYDLGWTYGNGSSWSGDWANYTRSFSAGTYNIYGRLSGGGGGSKVGLWKVTSGQGTSTQTTQALGEWRFTSRGWQTYDWVPLTDASGNLASITLSGVTTLRVMGDNANHNFYMLAPARDDLPLISNIYPSGTKPFEPANALTFNVSSTVATIPTADIKVTLNGLNVTPLLNIGGTPNNRSVSLAVLASNAMYTATISVKDSAGTFVSRSLTFDTFSESNYSFEAEDFDFGGGQYIDNPVLSTTQGSDNYYMQSVLALDYIDLVPNNLAGQRYDYRTDSAGTEATSDYLRQRYVTAQVADPLVKDYNVGWDVGGTWFNYTRTYPAGDYWIYARLAGSGALKVNLDKVTAGLGTTNQTLSAVGNFSAVNPASGWQVWNWVPLVNTNNGSLAAFTGGAVGTLRFTTSGNVNHNFLMLVPAKTPVSLTCTRTGGTSFVSIPTQAGAAYTLWYKNSLQDANWTYLTMVGGDGTTKTVTDATATGASRYYRASIQ